jgi:hypothetical protein
MIAHHQLLPHHFSKEYNEVEKAIMPKPKQKYMARCTPHGMTCSGDELLLSHANAVYIWSGPAAAKTSINSVQSSH